MNRDKFFSYLRSNKTKIFGTRLSQPNVDGINAILDSCVRNKVTNGHHVANVLAQVYRETGGYMSPIKETVYAHHTNKNPSDQTVINRLDNAWKKGQLTWVRTPYWRDGAFGRGQIQITHWPMYETMGKRLKVPLRQNPGLALELDISADIAVIGMFEGHFTGRKLSNYNFPSALDAPVKSNPRRIVNGQDGSDAEVARNHKEFFAAITHAGGWSLKGSGTGATAPSEVSKSPSTPDTTNALTALLEAFTRILKAMFGGSSK